jgi:hypothetical protein
MDLTAPELNNEVPQEMEKLKAASFAELGLDLLQLHHF